MSVAASLKFRAIYLVHAGGMGLSGKVHKPDQRPEPLFKGDPERGKRILSGECEMAGCPVRFFRESHWEATNLSPEAVRELHRFTWIHDVMAFSNTKLAARHMRYWVEFWIRHIGSHPQAAFSMETTGERLYQWLAHTGFVLAGCDVRFRQRWLGSIARQALQLNRALTSRHPAASFASVKGLVATALSLPHAGWHMDTALAALEQCLSRDVLIDGGHVSRSPAVQVELLRHLLEIKSMLARARVPAPELLEPTITRAARLLRMLLHGDGKLACMQGSGEGDAVRITRLLTLAGVPNIAPQSAPQMGYERLSNGITAVIMDTGAPNFSFALAHRAPLSFEMSTGPERLIVNCGTYRGPGRAWHEVVRHTAAHSTLTLDDRDSANPDRPLKIQATRATKDEEHTLEASHDGYEPYAGFRHTRRLRLSKDGDRLSGSDVLVAAQTTEEAHRCIVRFHVHAGASVTLRDEAHATLTLKSGERWEFHSPSHPLAIEESVYLGETGKPDPTKQMVIHAKVEKTGVVINWSISRISRENLI